MSSAIPEVSAEQLAAIKEGSIAAAAEIVGFDSKISDPDAVAGSLLTMLIGSPSDIDQCELVGVAGITYEELDTALGEWFYGGRAATLIMKSKARRFLKACKLACGVEWTINETQEYAEHQRMQASQSSVHGNTGSGSADGPAELAAALTKAMTAAVATSSSRKVKIAEVADITWAVEAEYISKHDVDSCVAKYVQLKHRVPKPDEMPSH